jgi:LysR family transcriptional regulator, transcriptional activator of nhaA
MRNLNYKYLEYFWAVAKEGSVTRAAESLFVTQPAISTQIRKLERQLGEKLLRKSGRNLVLTEMGQLVFRYADEIFSLGRELAETVRGQPSDRPLRLAVGVVDSFPKLMTYQLVAPALRMKTPVRLVVREGHPEQLYADLAVHALDLVLSDAPIPATVNIKAFNHLLGGCGVSVMAAARLAQRYRKGFPLSLDDAPFLLPTDNTSLGRSLDRWFAEIGIRPQTVAEIQDSAVLKVFGQEGAGLFVIPSVVEEQVHRQYHVEVVGRVEAVRERFYALSVERRLRHPAVVAITEAARSQVFGPGQTGAEDGDA